MSTILNPAVQRNLKPSLRDQIREIEEKYTGYPASGLATEIERIKERLNTAAPNGQGEADLRARLEDFECVLSMAVGYESLLDVMQQSLTAQVVKDDFDFVTAQVIDAFEENPDARQLEVEIQGDVIRSSITHNRHIFRLQAVCGDMATYSVEYDAEVPNV